MGAMTEPGRALSGLHALSRLGADPVTTRSRSFAWRRRRPLGHAGLAAELSAKRFESWGRSASRSALPASRRRCSPSPEPGRRVRRAQLRSRSHCGARCPDRRVRRPSAGLRDAYYDFERPPCSRCTRLARVTRTCRHPALLTTSYMRLKTRRRRHARGGPNGQELSHLELCGLPWSHRAVPGERLLPDLPLRTRSGADEQLRAFCRAGVRSPSLRADLDALRRMCSRPAEAFMYRHVPPRAAARIRS